ncbi:hypothetical protein [Streptomyces sp. NPDC096132]|uniref:hypothetical protein n=1 Tax=Streptomyces sp. NPDC096132 TaxID=3366075 RepID=UPI00382F9DBE
MAWTLPWRVAEQLNAEFGTSFLGRDPSECRDVEPVRRPELLGHREYLHVL